jgi:hypothetical protein
MVQIHHLHGKFTYHWLPVIKFDRIMIFSPEWLVYRFPAHVDIIIFLFVDIVFESLYDMMQIFFVFHVRLNSVCPLPLREVLAIRYLNTEIIGFVKENIRRIVHLNADAITENIVVNGAHHRITGIVMLPNTLTITITAILLSHCDTCRL